MNEQGRVIAGSRRWAIATGDCLDLVAQLEPNGRLVCITDPPWPDAPSGLFERGAEQLPAVWRLVSARARRIVVHLGRGSDPRCLSGIDLPFVCASWLRYAVPSYQGTLLHGGDVAYTFGDHRAPNGSTLIPSEVSTNDNGGNETGGAFPCPRKLAHVLWLVRWFSNPEDIILDPFCGSGTTGVAAVRLGRRFIGIEMNRRWAKLARRRVRGAEVAAGLVGAGRAKPGEQIGMLMEGAP